MSKRNALIQIYALEPCVIAGSLCALLMPLKFGLCRFFVTWDVTVFCRRRMNTNSQYQSSVELPFWVFPAAYTCLCLVLNYLAGSLDFPDTVSVREQRDFNAALGMPVVTGYLWITIRLLHQRAANSLINYLLSQHRLADFTAHRQRLEGRLFKQVLLSASMAIVVTLVYLSSEGLLALDLQLHVLLLNIMAVPFWFFIWLFILQITSTTLYVIKHFVNKSQFDLQELKKLKPISDLVISNTVYSAFAIALIPIFWYGKDVPAIDFFIVTAFFGSLALYLFWPVFKVQKMIKKQKVVVVDNLNSQMQSLFKLNDEMHHLDENERLRKLNGMQNQKEEVIGLSEWPLDLPQCFKVIAVAAVVPASWIMLSIVENLIA